MKNQLLLICVAFIAIFSCQNDDALVNNNSVSFSQQSATFENNTAAVNVIFMNPTAAAGSLVITVTPTNVENDTDFTTNPATSTDNEIILPFEANVTSIPVNLTALTGAIEGEQKSIIFKITSITLGSVAIPDATSSVQFTFNEAPLIQNALSPNIGGANVPNQVYVDLSSGIQTGALRTKWDIGFYTGTESRVVINGSIKMAARQLASSDMSEVVTIDPTVAVGEDNGGTITNGDIMYTDNPNGDINQTVISVADNDDDNRVYLVNLGYELSTDVPATNDISAFGPERGYIKMRVLRSATGYTLQYAALESTIFTEVEISVDILYNFTFFSFESGNVVTVEPEKNKWDLNFTTFTDHINIAGPRSIAVHDFVVTNSKAGTRAYQVFESDGVAYEDFLLSNVVGANFNTAAAADQRVIGSNWRSVAAPGTMPTVFNDRFYIIRDSASNIYKLRFTALANDAGVRGNPSIEYEILQ